MKQKRQRVYRVKRPAKRGRAPTSTGTVARLELGAGATDAEAAFDHYLVQLQRLGRKPRSRS